MKFAVRVISIIAILGSLIWFYFEPGFEPAVTFLFGVGGFLGSIKVDDVSKRRMELIRKRDNLSNEINIFVMEGARVFLSNYEYLDGLPESNDPQIKSLLKEGREHFQRNEFSLAIKSFKLLLDYEKDPSGISAANIQIGHCYSRLRHYLKTS